MSFIDSLHIQSLKQVILGTCSFCNCQLVSFPLSVSTRLLNTHGKNRRSNRYRGD